jgi:hypothetical protein
MTRLPSALAAAALLAATPAGAQLYKCLQDGRTVYQGEPCPDTAKQTTIRAPDAVPEKPLDPKAAAEKAQTQARAESDNIVDVMAGYTICAEKVGDFNARYNAAFEDWKQRNADAFTRFNANPDSGRALNERLQAERAKAGDGDAAARAVACGRIVAAIQPPRSR